MTTVEDNRRLASDLKAAMSDAEEMMKTTGGETGDKNGSETRSRLAAALESAKASLIHA